MKKTTVIVFLALTGVALAQSGVGELWGLVYLLTAPTLHNKQQSVFRGSSSGQLSTDIVTGPACGVGAIDLSDGCAHPMLGVM